MASYDYDSMAKARKERRDWNQPQWPTSNPHEPSFGNWPGQQNAEWASRLSSSIGLSPSPIPSLPSIIDHSSHQTLPLINGFMNEPSTSFLPTFQSMPPPSLQPGSASGHDDANGQHQRNDEMPKNERRNPPEAQWKTHKDNIYRLYITDNLTLAATMTRMETDYGFIASSVCFSQAGDTKDKLTLIVARKCIRNDSESGALSSTSRKA